MGIYQLGTAVTITETFKVLGTPADPTTVTYTVRDPDGGEVSYVFGVAPEVTHPAVGIYVLDLDNPAPPLPGDYYYEIVGTGAVEATGTGEFTILQSIVAPQDVLAPQYGPTSPWVDGQDIKAYCDVADDDICLLPSVAMAVSQILFQISGRQFAGRTPRIVRPIGSRGDVCWGWASGGWAWSGWPYAWAWGGTQWGWYDGAGCHCGCTALPQIMLPGYPVVEITEVKISGEVVPPDEYRLDGYRFLTRMRDPDNPHYPAHWPGCQILNLNDDQPGTFSINYIAGVDPPLAGKMAAAALACEFLPGSPCKLPTGVRRIVRSGITIDKIEPLADMLRKGQTGIVAIDAFMAAYNPNGLQRRPTIWSPDGPSFPLRIRNQ